MTGASRNLDHETGRGARVLVVDDEAFEGKRLAEKVTEHRVVAVGSGAAALAAIAVGPPYDLVLCDVILCDMTGADLLSRLRRDHPSHAHRLVFMARPQLSPIVQYLLDGVPNLCLEMPLDVDGLRGLIERRALSFSNASELGNPMAID